MLFGHNTLQATVTVCVTLICAFVVTGFAGAAYHRERTALGVQHYHQGLSLETRGEIEPAVEEYRKALLFAPDNTEYRLSLATALLDDGRLAEAQTHLEELLQDNPTSGPINLLLGKLAVQQHKLRQAIEWYQRGVYEYWPEAQLPRRRQARWELANLLSEAGDRNGFIGELMQLYTNLPANAKIDKLRVGFLLLSNGATSEASRIFQDLVKQFPQDAEVRRGLGTINFVNGDFVAARHDLQRALKLDPKNKDSAQMLSLTNEVIEMDPALPYIGAGEQTRRSKNLLERVIQNLSACSSASGEQKQRLSETANLLTETRTNEDAAVALQKAAAQLWAERSVACEGATPQDRALDTVFARIGHE